MKYHVVKRNHYKQVAVDYLRSYSVQVLLVVAYFSNDSSFTMKLTSILYETTAKYVKVVLNFLHTVPTTDVPE